MRLTALRRLFSHDPPAVAVPAATQAAPPAATPGATPGPATPWTPARLDITDALWGEGFLLPGGAEEVLRLAAPLGLSSASSLLLLGAGAGGPVRCIAERLDTWVHGCEQDRPLARQAEHLIQSAARAGLKRASVAGWDPEKPGLRRHAWHNALALEPMRLGAPERVLAALAQAVRPGGQLVLLDLVCEGLDDADPAVAAWLHADARRVPPLPQAALTRVLAGLGFDVRVAEDVSARQRRLVVQGWRAYLRGLPGRPDNAQAAALVAEAERWMRRLRLMQDGRLRLVRWHAIGRGAASGS